MGVTRTPSIDYSHLDTLRGLATLCVYRFWGLVVAAVFAGEVGV